MKTETYVCQSCHVEVTRPVARGQRPKWCPDCRARCVWQLNTFACDGCGKTVTATGTRFCNVTCSNRAKPPRPRRAKVVKPSVIRPRADRRGDIRAGFEDKDWHRLARGIEASSTEDEQGCWIWSRRIKDGYPVVFVGGRQLYAHRLSLMAKHEADLGSQAAHHMCATPACVNPEHLQPVTHRDNNAEMMARRSYLARIRDLEAALALTDPDHPLLRVVAVA